MVAEPLVHKASPTKRGTTAPTGRGWASCPSSWPTPCPAPPPSTARSPVCLGSHAVRALVPGDDARLLALALAEKLDTLNRIAAVAARLGRRCAAPVLQGFDHVYADLLVGRPISAPFSAPASASASQDAALVRQLDRLAAATAVLYAELDALADLEQSVCKLPTDKARRRASTRTDSATPRSGTGPWACEGFSRLHGQQLVQNPPLLWCWRFVMIKLWNHSLLDARAMNTCNTILEGYHPKKKM